MSETDKGKPYLKSLIDGEIHELDGEMTVGRLAKCSIVIDKELGASREHARLSVVDKDVFVTDLGSLNGTLVNGKEIENEAQLENGDVLIFDVNKYEVFIPSAITQTDLGTPNEEPAPDPNKTVFINRAEMQKAEQRKQSMEIADDERIEVAASKYDAAADRIAPEIPQQTTSEVARPEVSARQLSEGVEPENADELAFESVEPDISTELPSQDVEAKISPQHASGNAKPAEQVESGIESSKPVLPEKSVAPVEQPVEAVHRPGSWMVSADVNNSDRTVLAPGVVAMNAQAAQVDLTSISEPTIIVQTGENADTLLPLIGEQTEWSIGSSEDRSLRITHSGVSGNHAAIVREGSKWKVIDQMSINGTFVNGNRVNIRFINNEDLLRFGPVECRFVVPAGFVGARRSNKNARTRPWLRRLALPIVIMLIVGGGYYAYSTGIFPPVAESPTTGTQ